MVFLKTAPKTEHFECQIINEFFFFVFSFGSRSLKIKFRYKLKKAVCLIAYNLFINKSTIYKQKIIYVSTCLPPILLSFTSLFLISPQVLWTIAAYPAAGKGSVEAFPDHKGPVGRGTIQLEPHVRLFLSNRRNYLFV